MATLNGIAGCLHYSLGRGTGGLIGGTIVAVTGSLAIAFRYFGVGAAVAGLMYFCYEFFYAGGFRTLCKEKVIIYFLIAVKPHMPRGMHITDSLKK